MEHRGSDSQRSPDLAGGFLAGRQGDFISGWSGDRQSRSPRSLSVEIPTPRGRHTQTHGSLRGLVLAKGVTADTL